MKISNNFLPILKQTINQTMNLPLRTTSHDLSLGNFKKFNQLLGYLDFTLFKLKSFKPIGSQYFIQEQVLGSKKARTILNIASNKFFKITVPRCNIKGENQPSQTFKNIQTFKRPICSLFPNFKIKTQFLCQINSRSYSFHQGIQRCTI